MSVIIAKKIMEDAYERGMFFLILIANPEMNSILIFNEMLFCSSTKKYSFSYFRIASWYFQQSFSNFSVFNTF